MNVHVLPSGMIETNAYLLTAPERGEAVLIDAPGEVWAQVGPLLQGEKCVLREVWITHGHWDHIQGTAEVVAQTGAKVRAHPADAELMANPDWVRERMGFPIVLEPLHADRELQAGEKLSACGLLAEVRHVPGHCPGNVLFYFASEGVAFVGDALMAGGYGRTDLPGGDFGVLEKSIRGQIYTLPDETLVCSGHGPETTVGVEKRTNPYIRP